MPKKASTAELRRSEMGCGVQQENRLKKPELKNNGKNPTPTSGVSVKPPEPATADCVPLPSSGSFKIPKKKPTVQPPDASNNVQYPQTVPSRCDASIISTIKAQPSSMEQSQYNRPSPMNAYPVDRKTFHSTSQDQRSSYPVPRNDHFSQPSINNRDEFNRLYGRETHQPYNGRPRDNSNDFNRNHHQNGHNMSNWNRPQNDHHFSGNSGSSGFQQRGPGSNVGNNNSQGGDGNFYNDRRSYGNRDGGGNYGGGNVGGRDLDDLPGFLPGVFNCLNYKEFEDAKNAEREKRRKMRVSFESSMNSDTPSSDPNSSTHDHKTENKKRRRVNDDNDSLLSTPASSSSLNDVGRSDGQDGRRIVKRCPPLGTDVENRVSYHNCDKKDHKSLPITSNVTTDKDEISRTIVETDGRHNQTHYAKDPLSLSDSAGVRRSLQYDCEPKSGATVVDFPCPDDPNTLYSSKHNQDEILPSKTPSNKRTTIVKPLSSKSLNSTEIFVAQRESEEKVKPPKNALVKSAKSCNNSSDVEDGELSD